MTSIRRIGALVALGLLVAGRPARGDTPTWSVAVEPVALRLGVDRVATVTVVAPDRPASRISLTTSVGTLEPLERVAPGRFVARYTPPASRAPDVAVFAACETDGDRCAAASLPLAGRYHLTLAVEPSAAVVVSVGSEDATHARAPASGRLELMLHVPPGVDHAGILATDRVGNQTATTEPLELPPTHRALLIAPAATPARVRPGSVVRWRVAAASPDGTLSRTLPAVDVEGAPYQIVARAPGLFEVSATAPRRAADTVLALRSTARDLVASPARLETTVQGSPPSAVDLARGVRAPAGGLLDVPFTVRAADGERVVGLRDDLRARVGTLEPVSIVPRGEGYAIVTRAPERADRVAVSVSLAAGTGYGPLEATGDVRIEGGRAVRVVADATGTTMGEPVEIALRGLDRFGNPAPIGNPTVRARGALLLHVDAASRTAPLVVRVIPTASVVHLEVRGDYDLADAVDIPAQLSVRRPFTIAIVGLGRWNLGALVIGGARLRFEGDVSFAHVLVLATMVEVGGEGAASNDMRSRSVALTAAAAQARMGLLFQYGLFSSGLLGGIGARGVWATFREATGGETGVTTVLPLFSVALAARVRVPVGGFMFEIGYETGELDTPAVRGTFGGFQGALAWAYAF